VKGNLGEHVRGKRAGTYEIYRALLRGRSSFSELEKYIPTKTLAERLKELEGEGKVKQEVSPGHPPRAEYSLTSKGRNEFEDLVQNRFSYYLEDVFLVSPMEAVRKLGPYLEKVGYRAQRIHEEEQRRRLLEETGIEVELPQRTQPPRLHDESPTLEQLKRRFLDAIRDGEIRLTDKEALDKILSSPSYLQAINGILEESRFKKAEIGFEKDPKKINLRLWL